MKRRLIKKFYPEFNFDKSRAQGFLIADIHGRGHLDSESAWNEGQKHLDEFPNGEELGKHRWKKFRKQVTSRFYLEDENVKSE